MHLDIIERNLVLVNAKPKTILSRSMTCLLQTFQNCRLFLVRLFPRNWELPNLRHCEPQDMLHYFLCLNFTSRMLPPTLSALDTFPVWFSGCFTCFGRSIPPSPGPEQVGSREQLWGYHTPPAEQRTRDVAGMSCSWLDPQGQHPNPGTERSGSAPLVSQAAAIQREFRSCLYARIPAFYCLRFHVFYSMDPEKN